MEEPPAIVMPDAPTREVDADAAPPLDRYNLPTQEKADGSLLIDLMPLVPAPETCAVEEPDPFNPSILVCAKTEADPRLGPVQGPSADDLLFGSAIPRARVRLSDNAEAEANAIKQPVGGFDADGGEVRVKIEF